MTVVDRDGEHLGACTDVFHDDATMVTEWVRIERSGVAVLLPAVGAVELGGEVQVAVRLDDVNTAPTVGGPKHVSADEEAALYRHYGIPHSRDASSTVLPDGQPGEQDVSGGRAGLAADASAEGRDTASGQPVFDPGQDAAARAGFDTGPDTATRTGLDTGPDAATRTGFDTGPDTGLDTGPDTGLDTGPDAATRTGLDTGPDEAAGSESPAGGRRKLLVGGGRAGVATAAGVALGTRLVRARRQLTRRERLVRRGRAVAGAAGSGVTRVATSAVPALVATRRAVVAHPRYGAAAVAAALSAGVLRRRGNRPQPDATVPPTAVPPAAVGELTADERSRAAARRRRRLRDRDA